MDELDISQVKKILGLSYPTALRFAKEHGRLDPNASSRGKWFVPVSAVRSELQAAKQDIDTRLEMLPKNGSAP